MSTWELPVRKRGNAMPVIIGGAFAVLVGVGVLVVPGLISSGDDGDGAASPRPSGTLNPTSSPGASFAPGDDLPPLVGEATRASIFNDSSLEGIDLGVPVEVAPDLDFPVYELTDEVRAAMGPGWSLWLADDVNNPGAGEPLGSAILISSPGGTVFLATDRGDTSFPSWDEGASVWDWFPAGEQAFVFDGGEDSSSKSLVDLRTGATIPVPSDYTGPRSEVWELAGTRPDGSQVWYSTGYVDNGMDEWVNLVALEERSPSGEWASIPADYSNLATYLVMDPDGRYAIIHDMGRRIVEGLGESSPPLPRIAVIDTLSGARTNYAPLWPEGAESCSANSWSNATSFVASCGFESDSLGSDYRFSRVYFDGTTPPVEMPDNWRSPAWPIGLWVSPEGLVRLPHTESDTWTEIDIAVESGRIKVLDLSRLASTPGLEAAASGATSFYSNWGVAVGGSLVFVAGRVGDQDFCLAVDTKELTYDVIPFEAPVEGRRVAAFRCLEWGTAYFAWP